MRKMPWPFAKFSPVSWEKGDNISNHPGSQVQVSECQKSRGICVSVCIVFLAMGLTYNVYLSGQLRKQSDQQQIQLERLFGQMRNLTDYVNQLAGQSGALLSSSNDAIGHLRRDKRHSRQWPPDRVSEHLQIGRAFRWVDSNWTDRVAANRRTRRRHVEPIPKIELDNKQPAVDFFPLTQQRDQVWLDSYSRISLSALQEYCSNRPVDKECLRGPPGRAGTKGDKGDRGVMGAKGQQGVGIPGIRGPPGVDGTKGSTGLDGRDGLDGYPGLDGTPGRDGIDGRDGKPGQAGANGISGRNGTDGRAGDKGEPGIPGKAGPSGPPGKRGKVGPPGVDGAPGIQVQAWRHNSSTLLIAPSIDDMSDQGLDIEVIENESVNLKCVASGHPKPTITWRREDKRAITIDGISHTLLEGTELRLTRVNRDNFGEYLCVATNGIPPAATKRINLLVMFSPLVKIAQPRQMVGAVKGSWVVLQCYIEAYPEPFVEWIFGGSTVLEGTNLPTGKYKMTEKVLERRISKTYSRLVMLNISRVASSDFGVYKCQSHNTRGRTFGVFTLFESDTKTLSAESSLRNDSFVYYGEMPKLAEKKTQCEPCPGCIHSTKSSSSSQCKQGQRETIFNVGVSDQLLVRFNTSLKFSKRTRECYLSQIGKPVFYAEYGSHEIGCWMRDPKPLKAADSEKYWMTRLENDQLLEEFNSKEAFRSKTASYNYTLFHRFEDQNTKMQREDQGNAQAIYAGVFYYTEKGTSKMISFHLDTSETGFLNLEPTGGSHLQNSIAFKAARHVRSNKRRRTASGDLSSGNHLYSNHLNVIDIAADENGIWVVMPNLFSKFSNSNTVILKLNGTRVEYAWNLTLDHHTVGETFIMCGILYGVESVSSHRTHIKFAYDLYNDKELKQLEKIEFTNPFMSTSYIGYNSRYQYLYTWDKGNILEYPLKIDTKLEEEE